MPEKQVFISYSSDAEAECKALAELLQPTFECWCMFQDLDGRPWKDVVPDMITDDVSVFILLLSPGALRKEGYVETEADIAKDRIRDFPERPLHRFYLKVGVTDEEARRTWAYSTLRNWTNADFDISDKSFKTQVLRWVERAVPRIQAQAQPSPPNLPGPNSGEREPAARHQPPAGERSPSLLAETITAALVERGPLAYDDLLLAVVRQLNGVGAKSIEVEVRRLCAEGVLRMSDDNFAAKPTIWLK